MTQLNREEMSKYSCNYCKFYCDRWTCSLDECIFVNEAKQCGRPAKTEPVIVWEVIV